MTITTGDKIPSITTKIRGSNGLEDFNLADHVAGKKVVLIALPGAFTPVCDEQHLPGYVQNAETIKAQGIDEILCLTVNDPFVVSAWIKAMGTDGKITVVPDPAAEFTKAIGLEFDGSANGLGIRSKRYAMVLNDGVVESLDIEASPGEAIVSTAQQCLVTLGGASKAA